MSVLPKQINFVNKTQNEGAIKKKGYRVPWQIQASINESVRQEKGWQKIPATCTIEITVRVLHKELWKLRKTNIGHTQLTGREIQIDN